MNHDCTRFVGICVLFLAAPVEAQILKCIDAEKNVTYSDSRCERTEKMAFVDTRGAVNVMDHSFIRSQKGRVFAPVVEPQVYSAPAAPPPPAPFVVDRSVKSAVQVTTY